MPDNHLRIQSDEKRVILVVDDEMINREMLNMALTDDYSLLFAENGEEAIRQVKDNSRELSLILLDLHMPVMSGMDVLKALKEDPEWSKIPVIVLTSDHESEVASLDLGAIDFIPKPYPQHNVMLARIRRVIELSEDRQIIHSTERDHLTGLYNKEFFYNYAETFDQHHKDEPMDAIVMDINHFHLINERYGRMYADQILQQIAWNLRELVQKTGGMVCRREADTFLIYRPHSDDYSSILENASEGLEAGGDSANRVHLRLGVYQQADKSLGIEQRFDRAKTAADTIRNNYNKNVAVYDAGLHEREVFAEQLIEDFSKAIKEKQFKVFYQPKFDIRSDKPVLSSAEALVRWQHPDLGLVSPGIFIPLFEENGMIQRLDRYVWEEAASQIREWKEKLGIVLPVSVNVSRIDISTPDLPDVFRNILRQNGLDAGSLILEITESAYAEDNGFIISAVNNLRNLGLKVEMDDFGTGYSSLGMISQLPIDALKLDMIFVRNAFAGHGDMKMIELIIDIAGYLRVPVIAEGVETKEQVDVLKEMGCDMIQGYYFSRPVPAPEFEKFIEEKKLYLAEEAGRAEKTDHKAPAGDVMRESMTYAGIYEALAADYYSIYMVDMATGEFVEYSSSSEYKALNTKKNGGDFFEDCRKSVLRLVYPDDLNKALDFWEKERLQKQVENGGSFSVTYRLMFDETPVYINSRVIRMTGENEGKVLIAVSNVDEQIRREQEYQKDLRNARTAAMRDPLTGVKSKLAFHEAEREINTLIEDDDQDGFAVAVCDVNGLKTVNDTEGHKAGDKFLIDACRIVCNRFKHSPVYRIGGDEFVAILRGDDYHVRDQLLSEFTTQIKKNAENGGVVVACGIAEWRPGQDRSFESVFKRADQAMYENKKMLKAEKRSDE